MTDDSLAKRLDAGQEGDQALTAASSSPTGTSDGDAVAAWLTDHPDFFADRQHLLADLVLPHQAGQAVSLVERQLGVLRDRNAELHRRLRELTETARGNHRIFERTLSIASALVDADEPGHLVRRLSENLTIGFEVDASSLIVIDAGGIHPSLAANAVSETSARAAVDSLLRSGRIVCGMLREPEFGFLFGASAHGLASAAVMPVDIPGGMLLIAMGSKDADHFTPEMGTLFLRFLGEVLAQRMGQLIAHSATG